MRSALLVSSLLVAAMLSGCAMPGVEGDDDAADQEGSYNQMSGDDLPDDVIVGGTTAAIINDATAPLGSLSVYVKDAPTDEFSEIHINFTAIVVHVAGGNDDDEATDDDDAGDAMDGNGTDDGNGTTDPPAADGNGTAGGGVEGNGTAEGNATANGGMDGNRTTEGNGTMDDGMAGNGTAEGNGTMEPPAMEGNETMEPEADEPAPSCASGWVTIFESNGTDVDLLAAQGENAVFLGEIELPACKITQIRVHVADAYGIDLEGNMVDITLSNHVLKIVRSFEIEPGSEQRLLLDFDLDRALKKTGGDKADDKGQGKGGDKGQSGKGKGKGGDGGDGGDGNETMEPKSSARWRMTPVIGKALVTMVDDDESGAEVHEEGEVVELEEAS